MGYKVIAQNQILLKKCIEASMEATADVFEVPIDSLTTKIRKREFVDAKRSMISNLHLLFNNSISLKKYGEFVNKDHATAIHYIKTADNLNDANFLEKHARLFVRLKDIADATMTSGNTILEVIQFLQKEYPDVMFIADLSPNKYDRKIMNSVPMRNPFTGYPTIVIFEPRRGYHGYFIEIVTSITIPNTIMMNHVTQANLSTRGYAVSVVADTEECVQLINNYLSI